MKKISIIIPVYNVENYINRCLESLIKNKKYIYEVILIDDGSKDNSAKICKEYSDKYKFIKYFYQKNAGPSKARNMGLEFASGDYIMFVDSDDYIGNIKEIENIIKQYNSDYYIFMNMYKVINNKENKNIAKVKNGIYLKQKDKKILTNLIKEELINSPCSKIYRKDIIDSNNIRFNDKYNMAEDLLFNINYLNYCNNYVLNDLTFYYYCFNNEASLTQKYLENKYETLMNVNNELKIIFEEIGIEKILDYLIYKNLFSSIKDLHHKDCPLNKTEKILRIKQYKKNHKKKIMLNYGKKMVIWSISFSILPAKIIYLLTGGLK